ncbi:MAG: hypothetical protein M3680_09725 [Myxococcota bacterium]|nr:hypothetical protein [Myxococcota bacterium]
MQTQPLTREHVIQAVGDLDEEIIAEVISTGATPEDLEVAVAHLQDDLSVTSVGPTVVAVCDLLAPVLRPDDDDREYLGTD